MSMLEETTVLCEGTATHADSCWKSVGLILLQLGLMLVTCKEDMQCCHAQPPYHT